MEITVTLSDQLYANLETYCQMTGKTIDATIAAGVGSQIAPYYVSEGYGMEATYLKGGSKEELRAAKRMKKMPVIERVPCYVLGQRNMNGVDYLRIVTEGRLMSVPAECVEITD